jgi:hypothetical protein
MRKKPVLTWSSVASHSKLETGSNLVRNGVPDMKQAEINDVIAKYQLKKNERLSMYHFPTRRHAMEYEKNGTLRGVSTSLYNEEAVRFIIEHIQR